MTMKVKQLIQLLVDGHPIGMLLTKQTTTMSVHKANRLVAFYRIIFVVAAD